MARSPLTYTTDNTLGKRLSMLQAKHISDRGGLKVNISEVEQEVANYCGVSKDTIVMIKRGLNQPSLPLAMKICEFFDAKIEDIFSYRDIVCQKCDTLWDGAKTKRVTATVIKPKCQKCGSTIEG